MILVEKRSPIPPFEQIRQQFASQIRHGMLINGTRLPTVRRLAGDLGLAVNTVARAYRELEEAGFVETRGRAGTFVSTSGDELVQEAHAAAADFAASMHHMGVEVEAALALAKAALLREAH